MMIKYMVNSRWYRKIGFILLFALFIVQIPFDKVEAADKIIIASGNCGDDVTYILTEEAENEYTLTIDGSGEISDYYSPDIEYMSLERVPWWEYQKKIKRLIINKGITRIGANNFRGFGGLGVKDIKLPETLKEIGDYAFNQGINQEKLIIPEGVERIGKCAFAASGCVWVENMTGNHTGYIKSVILPSTLKYLGEGAFRDCAKLEDVTFLGDTEISSYVFSRCRSLTEVNMNGNVTRNSEAGYEFEGCTSLRNIHLSDTYSWENAKIYGPEDSFLSSALKNITVNGSHKFYKKINGILYTKNQKELVYCPKENEVTECEIPYGVEKIRNGAFAGQKNIEYICMPDTVKEIEYRAFATDSLKYVVISNAVTSIPSSAFANVSTLSVYVPSSVTKTSYWGKTSSDSFGKALDESYVLSIYGDENSYIAQNYPSVFKKAIYADFIADGKIIRQKVLFPNYKYGTLPEVESKDKKFIGWYTEENGGKLISPSDLFTGNKSVKLYAHWEKDDNYDYSIDNLSYDFSNSNQGFGYNSTYKIPYSSYKIIYGDTVKAKYFYNNAGLWGGSCYGMASTSGMFNYPDSGLDVKQFNSGVSKVHELKTSDKNSSNMSIKELIEAMHVSQYDTPIQKAYKSTRNDLENLYEQVYSVKNTGKTVLIGVFGPQGGHALLGYDLEKINNTEIYLYVYDCNFPYQKRHITLSTDADGKISGWYYYLNDIWHWGSEYKNCKINYVTYDNYYSEWKNRAVNKNNNILFLNSKSVAIYDSNNKLVATLQDGKLYTDNQDIYIIEQMKINADNTQHNQDTVMINLPSDMYTVKNTDSNISQEFQASMVGIERGITVATSSDEITFAVNDMSEINSVSVKTDIGDTYDIVLDSTAEIDDEQVEVSGISKGNVVSVSQNQGNLTLNNCVDASVLVNGKNDMPTAEPSIAPTAQPSIAPTAQPSIAPTVQPSVEPTIQPSVAPTVQPSIVPTVQPSVAPTVQPGIAPIVQPGIIPTAKPSTKIPLIGTVLKDNKNNASYIVNVPGKAVALYKVDVREIMKFKIPATVKLDGIKYNVTAISEDAFSRCKQIKYVSIGKNVISIGKKVFYGCKKLKKITIKSTKLKKKNIGRLAFKGISKKVTVKVPKKKKKTYKKWLKSKGIPKTATIK